MNLTRLLRFAAAFAIVFGAGVKFAGGADGTGPPPEGDQEVYYSFRGNPEKPPGFYLTGPDADARVRFEPDGLRITLPAGYPGVRPNTGVVSGSPVRGDFEITVAYEILQEPRPADAQRQTRFTLFVPSAASDRKRTTLSRRVVPHGGSQFFTWMNNLADEAPGTNPRGDEFVAREKTGRLRLARKGPLLSYYASEGPNGDFVLLQEYPFGEEDMKDVRLVVSTGGPKAALDVRILDLRIRSASSSPPSVSALPKSRWKVWLAAAIVGLAVTLSLGAWLYVRRGRRAVKAVTT